MVDAVPMCMAVCGVDVPNPTYPCELMVKAAKVVSDNASDEVPILNEPVLD